jgi:endonuclease YncB( thermonuclease family)
MRWNNAMPAFAVRGALMAGAMLLLAACDPLSFLDDGAARPTTARAPRTWTCRAVLTPGMYVLEEQGRVVTVTLAHVAVVSTATRDFVRRNGVNVSDQRLRELAREAMASATSLWHMTNFGLQPTPGYTDRRITAQLLQNTQVDVGLQLIVQGLALVVSNSPLPIPQGYEGAQREAIERERGVWRSGMARDQRFSFDVAGAVVPADAPPGGIDNDELPSLHARDIYTAPPPTLVDEAEPTVRAMMRCDVNLRVNVLGPPKQYELTVRVRQRVVQNELSGPLSSFKEAVADWEQEDLVLRGGGRTNIYLCSAAQELSRVTRALRQVYSGTIITGYELEILQGEETLYRTSEAFGTSPTLSALR